MCCVSGEKTYFEGVVSFLEVRATSLLVSGGGVEFAPPVNCLFLLRITISLFNIAILYGFQR